MAATATASAPASTSAARLHRMGADGLYVLTGLATSIVAFTVWITGLTLSLTFGLLIVGFPVVLGTFAVFRWLADLERRRAALVLGEPLISNYRRPPEDRRLAARLKAVAHDPQRWKDLAYHLIFSVIGFTWGTIWLVLWGFVLGSITLPRYVDLG